MAATPQTARPPGPSLRRRAACVSEVRGLRVGDELGLGVGLAGPLDLNDALEGHAVVADAEEDRVLGGEGSGGPAAAWDRRGGAAERVPRGGGSPNPATLRNEQRRRRLRWRAEREEVACVGAWGKNARSRHSRHGRGDVAARELWREMERAQVRGGWRRL